MTFYRKSATMLKLASLQRVFVHVLASTRLGLLDGRFRRLLALLLTLLIFQFIVNIVVISHQRGRQVWFSLPPTDNRTIPRHSSSSYTSQGAVLEGVGSGMSQLSNFNPLTLLKRLFLTEPRGPPPLCPAVPPNLVGLLPRTYMLMSYEELERVYRSTVLLGGESRPVNCTARYRVALVVPYRDRDEHLRIFLGYMHRYLQKQQIDYGIYVVEQEKLSSFNRGMLMNIGFTEARKVRDYDCFIFHDVDLLPENDKNLYWCPDMPRHMSAAVDSFFYRLPYQNLFGGVEAFKTSHFELINGFSNEFFGWGGEDDDLFNRIVFHNLNLTRYSMMVARYRMINHQKQQPSSRSQQLVKDGPERFERDGLNSLHYRVDLLERRSLFTLIRVTIDQDLIMKSISDQSESVIK